MSETLSPARRWGSLAVLVGGVLLLAIDGTVLFLAVPSLTAALAPTATQVLWIGDIYSLVIAGLLVTMGNLADRIGRKKLLLIGSAAFGAASAFAAFAPTAEALIAARLLLGVAGATIMPSTLSLIRNIFADPIERTRAIAIWSAASSSGIALGPIIGGALLEHFWWGSVFLINLPVIALVIIFGAWLLPESKDPEKVSFDLLSSLLSMIAIAPLVYAIKLLSGNEFGVPGVVAILASAIGAILFVRRQRRVTSPMIDVNLFRNWAFSGAVLVNFISVFALVGVLFFFAQYLQLARGLSPMQAGLAELPAAISAMIAVLFVGIMLRRLGRGRAIGTALLVSAVGLGLLAALESSEWIGWVLLPFVPLALGLSIAETLSVDAVVSAVSPAKAGAASSISETAYELGVTFGIAGLGSLFAAFYHRRLVLPEGLPAAVKEQAADSLAGAAAVLEPGSEALIAAQHAFVDAMQITTLVAAVIMVLAAVASFVLIPNHKTKVAADH